MAGSGYTIVRTEEVPDPSGDVPGEVRFLTSSLGSEDVALSYRLLAPGTGHIAGKREIGHRHKTQEEIYFLISGNLEAKLDDEVIEIGPGTAIRIAPEVVRSFWNGGDEDAVVVIVSNHAVDAREDAEMVQDFWPH